MFASRRANQARRTGKERSVTPASRLSPLDVARRVLLDAVPGGDRVPHLDERLLGGVGTLARAVRGRVGAGLAGRRTPAVQLLLGPEQVIPVGSQRGAQRRH